MIKNNTDEFIGQIMHIASIVETRIYLPYDVPKGGVSEAKNWLNQHRKK